MKTKLGGMNIPIMVAVLALALGITWAAINLSLERWFNPTPEITAENFISSLAAHRYTGAHNNLTSDLRDEVSLESLQILIAGIEVKKNGIEQAKAEEVQQYGDTAFVSVRIEMKDGSELTVELPLLRENGLWKISALEEMWTLVFTSPRFRALSL